MSSTAGGAQHRSENASPYGSYLASAYVLNAAAINAGSKPPSELGVKALDAHTYR